MRAALRTMTMTAIALVALVGPVAAEGEDPQGPPWGPLPCNGEITAVQGYRVEQAIPPTVMQTIYYLDRREIDPSPNSEGGIWMYEETNGWAGLQSGGQSKYLGDRDVDLCQNHDPFAPPPDQLII